LVKRAAEGESIQLFTGTGDTFDARVERAAKNHVGGTIISRTRHSRPLQLTLCAALIKGERFDWLVEKAVELGVSAIQPLITSRGTVKPHAGSTKVERWERIALAACKQSMNPFLPAIAIPRGFSELLADTTGCRVILRADAHSTLRQAVAGRGGEPVSVWIGPEGGFSSDEYDAARAAGCAEASLGLLTLRTETACVAALAVVRDLLHTR